MVDCEFGTVKCYAPLDPSNQGIEQTDIAY